MTSVTIPRAGSRAPSAASFRYRSLSAFTDDSLTWRPSVPLLMPRASYVPSVYQRRSLGRHSQNHERYCLRKSFSMGQLDVGFPNSYVHQIYLEAGGQTDARNARKLVRLLQKKFVKREPERLLRNISEKKLRRLHNCLLPTLCWQIFFCFLAAAVFREDGWFQGWLIRKFVDFAFYFRSSNDYLPYKYFLPPGAENGSPIDTSENQSVPFACCMWHSEVANKTEPAACNHYLATSTDIHLVGCFDFIFYLTVYVWLGLHLLLLAPPTLLLVSGTLILPPPPSFYAL
nr:unnamed protein product [Spirometra erinaceieuropaei]